ncbi:MAG: hypothetical protein ACLRRJ_00825 [Clostridium sp.]
MRENRISVFRKHTLGILVALGMVLFGSVFILFTNIGKTKRLWQQKKRYSL